jgi:hypothetical protein
LPTAGECRRKSQALLPFRDLQKACRYPEPQWNGRLEKDSSMPDSRTVPGCNGLSFIPRHPGEEEAHAAEVADAGEDKAGADEAGEPDETVIEKLGEENANKDNRTGDDADLAFEADDFGGAAGDDGRIGFALLTKELALILTFSPGEKEHVMDLLWLLGAFSGFSVFLRSRLARTADDRHHRPPATIFAGFQPGSWCSRRRR